MKSLANCRHTFDFSFYSGRGARGRTVKLPGGKTLTTSALMLGFRCRHCGEAVERKATPGERKFHALDGRRHEDRGNVHKVWHEFSRRFKTKNDEYRWIGFPLIDRVEVWADKYPKDIRVVSIDDSSFASSILVLIEHRTLRQYMGTTGVLIPQCTGESPVEFFLYPGHRRGLLKALVDVAAAARPIERMARADRIKRERAIRQSLQHPAVL